MFLTDAATAFRTFLFIVAVGALGVAFAGQENVQRLTIVADEWCPYNCDPTSERPGYIVELATAVFADAGYQVQYITEPWSRAIVDTESGEFDGLIGGGRTEVPNFVFPEVEQGVARHALFTLTDTTWIYSGPESLEGVSLGVIASYSYGTFNERYILPQLAAGNPHIQVVGGDKGLELNLRKLAEGRIQSVAEDSHVFWWRSLDSPDDKLKYREAGVLDYEKVYIAFSPANKHSAELARVLSNGTMALRRSGELQKILARYGMHDWINGRVEQSKSD